MDPQRVAEAVDEVGRVLRADGADLLLLEADPKTLRIRLELRLDTVDCADCVLPPNQLVETITQAIQRRVPGEFELVLDDPRR
jgi:NifU-like domain